MKYTGKNHNSKIFQPSHSPKFAQFSPKRPACARFVCLTFSRSRSQAAALITPSNNQQPTPPLTTIVLEFPRRDDSVSATRSLIYELSLLPRSNMLLPCNSSVFFRRNWCSVIFACLVCCFEVFFFVCLENCKTAVNNLLCFRFFDLASKMLASETSDFFFKQRVALVKKFAYIFATCWLQSFLFWLKTITMQILHARSSFF